MSELIVAKFGGTSMAQPEYVFEQLEHGPPEIVVVSAPGTDEGDPYFDTKVTDALRQSEPNVDYIKSRYERMCQRLLLPINYRYELEDQVQADLQQWKDRGDPLDALGEKWAAQVLARKTGREFVDAAEIIRFDRNGLLNEYLTNNAIQQRLIPGRQYVVPGYYGADRDGKIHTLPRGGSDITGALIAKALDAKGYHNWSDVPGFMTANPKVVGEENAKLLSEITYLESRNMGICGAALLHTAVRGILEGTGIPTVMRNTFGSRGNRGTAVVDNRDWEVARPVISVSGEPAFQLYAHKNGGHDDKGATLEMTQALKDCEISFHQAASGGDDFSYYVSAPDIESKDGKGEELYTALLEKFECVQGQLTTTHLEVAVAGMLHIIGEGLRKSGRERGRAVGMATFTLNDYFGGVSDMGKSSMATLFLEDPSEERHEPSVDNLRYMQEVVDRHIRIVHSGLSLAS